MEFNYDKKIPKINYRNFCLVNNYLLYPVSNCFIENNKETLINNENLIKNILNKKNEMINEIIERRLYAGNHEINEMFVKEICKTNITMVVFFSKEDQDKFSNIMKQLNCKPICSLLMDNLLENQTIDIYEILLYFNNEEVLFIHNMWNYLKTYS
jgi:hypothetical protein